MKKLLAIKITYLGATNTKPSRVKAQLLTGVEAKPLVFSYDSFYNDTLSCFCAKYNISDELYAENKDHYILLLPWAIVAQIFNLE